MQRSRLLLMMWCTCRPGAAQKGGGRLVLQLLDDALVERSDARCLDGSNAGYYWSAGSGVNASKFIVFLEGGGWCFNATECALRAFKEPGDEPSGYLGSTVHAPLSLDPHGEGGHGILSDNATLNPDFHDWSVAMLNYCDGGSFAGAREGPVTVPGFRKPIWFRGHAIFNAVLADLRDKHSLASASHAILGGCSAGGMVRPPPSPCTVCSWVARTHLLGGGTGGHLRDSSRVRVSSAPTLMVARSVSTTRPQQAVYLHCDAFAAAMGPDVPTRCIADAGFFPDVLSVHGVAVN
jgi:hypothetical protein